jgi:protein-S-isoprenylcysteine O-methyltransferase Ste14
MIIFIIIWASWGISEIILSRFFRAKSPNAKGWDKGSFSAMWLTIIISVLLGVIIARIYPLPVSKSSYLIPYSGLFVIVTGVIIRIIAIRTLGRFFTVNLSVRNDQQIVTSGLYKHIRHPSYTGSLLSFAGLGLSFNNWLSLIIIFVPVLFAFIYRINVEEKLMQQQFGSAYSDYMKITKRLLPLVY